MSINLLPGEAIRSNTITVTQMNTEAWAQVYAAYAAANTAYAAANAAYDKANTGTSLGLVIGLG